MAESFPMNGGDGAYSYTKNSEYQRAGSNAAKEMICEVISEKLDVKSLASTSNIFRIADLGCSVGPNTFFSMHTVLESVENKYLSQGFSSPTLELQVFFNDHVSNDFNTLFASLPPNRQYFAAGVPGSFYDRLFPASYLHIVHSSYALQWLSKVPDELLDKNSLAWNKGRIHYTSASDVVANAYLSQFEKDMEIFLNARAKEIVVGGMMVLITLGRPDDTCRSELPVGLQFDAFGSSLMDMMNAGIVDEALVDSFNVPIYSATSNEMAELIGKNGCFSIVRMELTTAKLKMGVPVSPQGMVMHLRTGMEGLLTKHFGSEIIDELFERTSQKMAALCSLESGSIKGSQLFVVLKRK